MDVPILGQPQPRKGKVGGMITAQEAKALGPQIRLLICFVCKTIEELPDYEGDPEHDDLLEVACEPHQDAAGVRHLGHLLKVPLKYWTNPEAKREVIKQIREGTGGISEFDKDFYDTKSTFHEDAMACFRVHQRPKGRCPDWKHDSKKLVPKTQADRKELGLRPKSAVTTYLCDFCPAKVYMMTKAREEKGLYD